MDDNNLRLLDPSPNARNAFELLEERATSDEEIELVIIIELHKDGSRRINTSRGSMEEKCLLKAMFDSYIIRWFDDREIE